MNQYDTLIKEVKKLIEEVESIGPKELLKTAKTLKHCLVQIEELETEQLLEMEERDLIYQSNQTPTNQTLKQRS